MLWQKMTGHLPAPLSFSSKTETQLAWSLIRVQQLLPFQDIERFQSHFMGWIDDDDIITAHLLE
jgi:hypothetical protein